MKEKTIDLLSNTVFILTLGVVNIFVQNLNINLLLLIMFLVIILIIIRYVINKVFKNYIDMPEKEIEDNKKLINEHLLNTLPLIMIFISLNILALSVAFK